MATAPALERAGLLAVTPVATFAGLRGATLVRLTPHDGVGARAIADWLTRAGVGALLVVHDHDRDYGVAVGAMCADAARDRGIAVRARPIWDHDEPWQDDVRGAGRCSTSASRGRARPGSGATCTRRTPACGCSARGSRGAVAGRPS